MTGIASIPTRTPGDLEGAIANVRAPLVNELTATSIEAIKTRIIELATSIGLSSGATAGSIAEALGAALGSGDYSIMRQGGAHTRLRHNFATAADPVVGDDTGDGYGVGSLWVSSGSGLWLCVDATLGAAVWLHLVSGTGATSSANIVAALASVATDVAFNSKKLTSVLDPTSAQDVATKNYVDAMAQGLSPKASVRVATTAAGTLATSFENGDTVDGVVLATGDRILIKDQAAGAENGIYTVNASGAPTRATDFDANADVASGAWTFAREGTVNADLGFVLTTNAAIVIGTTALVFAQFSGGSAIDYAESGDIAALGLAGDAGVSTEIPRADHVHAYGSWVSYATTPQTMPLTARGVEVDIATLGAAFTLNLPTLASAQGMPPVHVRLIGNATHAFTLHPNGTDKINGSNLDYVLPGQVIPALGIRFILEATPTSWVFRAGRAVVFQFPTSGSLLIAAGWAEAFVDKIRAGAGGAGCGGTGGAGATAGTGGGGAGAGGGGGQAFSVGVPLTLPAPGSTITITIGAGGAGAVSGVSAAASGGLTSLDVGGTVILRSARVATPVGAGPGANGANGTSGAGGGAAGAGGAGAAGTVCHPAAWGTAASTGGAGGAGGAAGSGGTAGGNVAAAATNAYGLRGTTISLSTSGAAGTGAAGNGGGGGGGAGGCSGYADEYSPSGVESTATEGKGGSRAGTEGNGGAANAAGAGAAGVNGAAGLDGTNGRGGGGGMGGGGGGSGSASGGAGGTGGNGGAGSAGHVSISVVI